MPNLHAVETALGVIGRYEAAERAGQMSRAEAQQAASNDIANRVERIVQMTEQSAATIGQTSEAARDLQASSHALLNSVARFKLK